LRRICGNRRGDGGATCAARRAGRGYLLAHISINLPASLPGEDPASFPAGGFQLGASKIALPVTLTAWDWLSGPIVATVALGVCGWWMADRKAKSLWAAIRT
jgi:hypothetical protein